ncbi:MAG: cyclase [Acidobacteria bacterium]|nr:MAG: cyclase [Acidobacteriota bacterium]PYY07455.1 MAG: cyclase [Acidobacteriota bacterium]
MKWKTFVIGYVLALAILLFAQRHTAPAQGSGFTAVLDLSHVVSSNAPAYELRERSVIHAKTAATLEKLGYSAREMSLPEHLDTYIDAPAHFTPGLWTVNKIPAERLVAPLAVLDVRAGVEKNPDYQVSIDDIAAWEKAHGQIPQGAVVVARTGWESHWNSVKDYRNADAKGVMHFPGYSPEAARFLVEGRNTIGLGIDTLSIDYGPSKDFPVHQYTLSHSLYHLENVANLGPVPVAGAMVVVAPMKLAGGSGGPVRVLALAK